MFDTPILFLIFNRPETTALVFEQIKKVRPTYLFIAADGPRSNRTGEADLCKASRDIVLEGIDWDCELKTLLREENLGCGKAVSEAIVWFFEHVEEGIILEDDCLPDLSFFSFCSQLLEKYRHDERIMSIGGTNMGYILPGNNSYGFSRYMNMWGWATWKRSMAWVDYDMNHWKKVSSRNWFLYKRTKNRFGLDISWIRFWKNCFDMTASGQIDTWDYQWIFSHLLLKKKSIFPADNLIINLGFGPHATHTTYADTPLGKLELGELSFPLQHPALIVYDENYEEEYIKKIWFNNKRESIPSVIKTRLLYIPIVWRFNKVVKGQKHR
jgi:hypothetical protein